LKAAFIYSLFLLSFGKKNTVMFSKTPFLSLFLTFSLFAQSPQKTIVWERSNLETKEATKKVIEWNKQGQKMLVYQEKGFLLESYEYDVEGRIVKKWTRGAYGDSCVIVYQYEKNLSLIKKASYNDWKPPEKYIAYQYLNDKGLPSERKKYKNIADSLVLKEWRQFFYDERDSLVLERLVLTKEQKTDYLPLTKVEYEYREEDGQLQRIGEYSEKRLLAQTVFREIEINMLRKF